MRETNKHPCNDPSLPLVFTACPVKCFTHHIYTIYLLVLSSFATSSVGIPVLVGHFGSQPGFSPRVEQENHLLRVSHLSSLFRPRDTLRAPASTLRIEGLPHGSRCGDPVARSFCGRSPSLWKRKGWKIGRKPEVQTWVVLFYMV